MSMDWSKAGANASIAVTGANGFIGAHCVLALLKDGFSVVAVVRDPTNPKKTDFLKEEAAKIGAADRLTFQAGDLLKEGSYTQAFKGCTGVLHTAAVVDISGSGDKENTVVRPSVEGTRNVITAIKDNKATVSKFVHLSSCAAIQSLEKPEDHVFTEKDWNTWSNVGNDAYGYAKAQAEKVVWDTLKGVPFTVINPGVCIGPVFTKEHTKSSTVFIRQMLQGNSIINFNCTFVDVRSVAAAAVNAFRIPEAAGKRFLVLGPEGPMTTVDLNKPAKEAEPWVKGSKPKFAPLLLNVLWAVGKIPVVGTMVGGLDEFSTAMMFRKIKFDNTQSKEVLQVKYRSLVDTCRDAIKSMKPFATGVTFPENY